MAHRERQELAVLPGVIEQLEGQIADLHQAMAQADFYQQPGAKIAQEQSRLKDLESQLATAYDRWQQLEQAE